MSRPIIPLTDEGHYMLLDEKGFEIPCGNIELQMSEGVIHQIEFQRIGRQCKVTHARIYGRKQRLGHSQNLRVGDSICVRLGPTSLITN
jgi:hypothetical protein